MIKVIKNNKSLQNFATPVNNWDSRNKQNQEKFNASADKFKTNTAKAVLGAGNLIKNSGGLVKLAGSTTVDKAKDGINSARASMGNLKNGVVSGVKNLFTLGSGASKRTDIAVQSKNTNAKQDVMIAKKNDAIKKLNEKTQKQQNVLNNRKVSFRDTMKKGFGAALKGDNKGLDILKRKNASIVYARDTARNNINKLKEKGRHNEREYKKSSRDIELGRKASNNFKSFSNANELYDFANTNPIFKIEADLMDKWYSDIEIQQLFSNYFEFEEYVITNFSDMNYEKDYLSQFEPIINFVNFSNHNLTNFGIINTLSNTVYKAKRLGDKTFNILKQISNTVTTPDKDNYNFALPIVSNAAKLGGNILSKKFGNNLNKKAEEHAYNKEQKEGQNFNRTEIMKDMNKGVGPGYGYGIYGKENSGRNFINSVQERIDREGRLGTVSDIIVEEFFNDIDSDNLKNYYTNYINFFKQN